MFSISGSMSVPLMSLVGWSLIPDFTTKHVLSLFHRFLHRTPPPPPGSRPYHQHYAATFALVVLTYLLYNLIASASAVPYNFYEILGVSPNVDENGLKFAFRQFAKRNHPDRPDVGRDGEELFIMIRDVYEALKDPVVRFAYDRFGPDVLAWDTCSTTRDYIQTGLMQSSGYHIFVGIALVFWSLVGAPSPVSFWRYVLYASFFAAEISLILSPSPSPTAAFPHPSASTYTTHTPLHTLFPNRLIHQHIKFLHQLFLFLSIALTRVVPVLVAAFSPPQLSPEDQEQVIRNLAAMVGVADRESSIVVHTLLHSIASPAEQHEMISSLARPRPFGIPDGVSFAAPNPNSDGPLTSFPSGAISEPEPASTERTPATRMLRMLADEMEELIIEANIKKEDGPLRSVWESAMSRDRRNGDRVAGKKEGKRKLNFWEAGDEGESEDETADAWGGDDGKEGDGEEVDARQSLPSPVTPTIPLLPRLPMSPRSTSSGRARSVSY